MFVTSLGMAGLDDHIGNIVGRDGMPGIAYVHFDPVRVIEERYAGKADIATGRPVDAGTGFHGFSTTKTMTALAVLQLVRKGVIDLDSRAKDLLPTMPYAGDIRIRHLLTHTAGLPNPLPLAWVHDPSERTFDRDAFFARIFKRHDRVRCAPGERYAYSNLGYILLGQLIERVTGLRYETVVEQRILIPTGATSDELGFARALSGSHATGYLRSPSLLSFVLPFMVDTDRLMGERTGRWRSFHPFLVNGASYGGIIGTATGFRAYLQALMRGSVLVDDAGRELLFRENRTKDGKRTGMAMGWFTGTLHGERYVAHAGGGGGYYAEIRLYPDLGRGSALLFNRTGVADERALDRFDAHMLAPLDQNQ